MTKDNPMNTFSKKDTSVIKGLAVLMLICHHLGMGILPAPINWRNESFYTIIATLCKVCVAIFVFLSGYGINESHKRFSGSDFSFVKKHLIKLMKQFWFIYIIFVPLGFLCGENPIAVYGKGIQGFANFILDFLGLKSLFNTQTMNQTWWYMETVIVLYLFYPVINRMIKKIPMLTLAAAFVPLVVYSYFCDGSYDNCREIFWVFPFAAGVLFSQHDLLNKYAALLNRHNTIVISCVTFAALAMTALRSYFGVIADTFYAIAIILFMKATFCRIKYAREFFDFMGVHSANIFMMHSFLYCYYLPIKQLLFVVPFAPFNYAFLVLECVVVSDYIEITKRRLSSIKIKSKSQA